jgi:hypothetical protein
MRRAVLALTILTAAVVATPLHASGPQVVERINGIGLVDYARKPAFKVGDWARYHMTAKSDMGFSDDYTVTVLVAGEEEWWGERCFWIETWTEIPGKPPQSAATLMSYAVFDDSLAIPHMQLYMRKTISGVNEDGTAKVDLYRRAAVSLKSRKPISDQIAWTVDTVGTESVETPKGTFECRRVEIKQGKGISGASTDSSSYTEVRENRTTFLTTRIPITSIAREDVEYLVQSRTWMTGRSTQASAAMNIQDRARGTAALVDYGSGLEARLVPPELRRSMAEQARPAKPAASRAPTR